MTRPAAILAALVLAGCAQAQPPSWDTSGPDYVDAMHCDHVEEWKPPSDIWRCTYNGQDGTVAVSRAKSEEAAAMQVATGTDAGQHTDRSGDVVFVAPSAELLAHAKGTYDRNR